MRREHAHTDTVVQGHRDTATRQRPVTDTAGKQGLRRRGHLHAVARGVCLEHIPRRRLRRCWRGLWSCSAAVLGPANDTERKPVDGAVAVRHQQRRAVAAHSDAVAQGPHSSTIDDAAPNASQAVAEEWSHSAAELAAQRPSHCPSRPPRTLTRCSASPRTTHQVGSVTMRPVWCVMCGTSAPSATAQHDHSHASRTTPPMQSSTSPHQQQQATSAHTTPSSRRSRLGNRNLRERLSQDVLHVQRLRRDVDVDTLMC
jgi:hypothetical protein